MSVFYRVRRDEEQTVTGRSIFFSPAAKIANTDL